MTRRLVSVALAAVALAGGFAAVVPQHAASLALVAAGTVVVVSAVFLLLLAGPLATAAHPVTALDVAPRAGAPALDPQGLRDARRDVAARHAPGSLPAPVRDRLVRAGLLDPSDPPATGTTADPAGTAELVHRLLDVHDPLAAPTETLA